MAFGWNARSVEAPFTGKLAVGNLVEINYDRLLIIVATILFVIAIRLFFRRTRYGIAMQAASQNQLAAYYMGIPVKRLVSLTWALGAFIAAAAGALLAPVTQVDTTIGPSGAGKTSFLRAGVISGRPEGWTAVVMTPGAQPFRALGRVLGPELAGDSEALGMLADAEEPDTAVELVGRWRRSDAEGLLVVDQQISRAGTDEDLDSGSSLRLLKFA